MQRAIVIGGHIVPSEGLHNSNNNNNEREIEGNLKENDDGSVDDVIITHKHENGCLDVILNRPKALNSLTVDMLSKLHRALDEGVDDSGVQLVLVTALSMGFCAGGDLKQFISDAGRWRFTATEYLLNRKIHRLPISYISILDGVVMGGGAGISMHGRYRIVTEKTTFAMPEVLVGFFADVGATFFLNYCPGYIGLYLALTGAKVNASDAMICGLGTHFILSKDIPTLLKVLRGSDVSTSYKIESFLNEFSTIPQTSSQSNFLGNRDAIDRCFSADTVEGIIRNLEKEDSIWAKNTIKTLLHNCPTSLKVGMEALKRAKDLTLEEALHMELRIGVRLVNRQDMIEGVTAVLIQKSRDVKPKWNPSCLEDVTTDFVNSFFEPFEDCTMELNFDPGWN